MCDLFDGSTYVQPTRRVHGGAPAFDSDHRCLFRIVDLLRGLDSNDEAEAMISTALEMIAGYAAFHFRRQERVMVAVGFAGAAFHRREHLAFEGWLMDLRAEHGGSATPETAFDLWERLTSWLHHHVLLQDVALRPYMTDVDRVERIAREGAAACLISPDRRATPRSRRDFGLYAASAMVS